MAQTEPWTASNHPSTNPPRTNVEDVLGPQEDAASIPFDDDVWDEGMDKDVAMASLAEDPWKHRSARMSCGSCMWFILKVSNNTAVTAPIGRCRKHAPTMDGYPVVFETDWCGDHKLDENKS